MDTDVYVRHGVADGTVTATEPVDATAGLHSTIALPHPASPEPIDHLGAKDAAHRAHALVRGPFQPEQIEQTTQELRHHLAVLLPVCARRAAALAGIADHDRLHASLRSARDLLAEAPPTPVPGTAMAALVYLRLLADAVTDLARHARQALPLDPRPVLRTARAVLDPAHPPAGQRLQDAATLLRGTLAVLIPALESRAWLLPADGPDRQRARAALTGVRPLLAPARPAPAPVDQARALARAATSLLHHLQAVSR